MSRRSGRDEAAQPELERLAATLDVSMAEVAFLADLSPDLLERLDADLAGVLAADDAKVEAGLRNAVGALPRPLRGRGAKLVGMRR